MQPILQLLENAIIVVIAGSDLGILRGEGGGGLGRNSSRGGGVGSRSTGIFIYWHGKPSTVLLY